MHKLRDKGRIKYTQPKKKIILYELESIYEYPQNILKYIIMKIEEKKLIEGFNAGNLFKLYKQSLIIKVIRNISELNGFSIGFIKERDLNNFDLQSSIINTLKKNIIRSSD